MKHILPHVAIVISGMLIVLLAIDMVNSAMFFIDNAITKRLLWVLAIVSIINAIRLLSRRNGG